MRKESDVSILERISARDPGAVEQCLDLYGRLVWSIAKRLLPETLVEDVVQEVFVDIWRSASRFDPGRSSEKTFVAMIARRRVIDRLRRTEKRPATEPLDEVRIPPDDLHLSVETNVDASLAARVLKQLRPKQRDVIQMSIYQGMSHSEIAAKTGLPLGTVKTYILRGLQQVRDLMLSRTGGEEVAP